MGENILSSSLLPSYSGSCSSFCWRPVRGMLRWDFNFFVKWLLQRTCARMCVHEPCLSWWLLSAAEAGAWPCCICRHRAQGPSNWGNLTPGRASLFLGGSYNHLCKGEGCTRGEDEGSYWQKSRVWQVLCTRDCILLLSGRVAQRGY